MADSENTRTMPASASVPQPAAASPDPVDADRAILDQFHAWRAADRASDAFDAIDDILEAAKAGDAPLLEMVAVPAAGLPGVAAKIVTCVLIDGYDINRFAGPNLAGRFVGPDIGADNARRWLTGVRPIGRRNDAGDPDRDDDRRGIVPHETVAPRVDGRGGGASEIAGVPSGRGRDDRSGFPDTGSG